MGGRAKITGPINMKKEPISLLRDWVTGNEKDMIDFICPICDFKISVVDNVELGDVAKCPHCLNEFEVRL